MTVNYFYKDGCHIYWRLECFTNSEQPDKIWEFAIYRSLSGFDQNDEQQEVFHGSVCCFGEMPDVHVIISLFARYYQTVFLGMTQFLKNCYEPEIIFSPSHSINLL